MSWSGTVTCSYCYERGHNRRSCPQITQRVRDRYDRAVRELAANPDDAYYIQYVEDRAKELTKRTGVDPRTGKKAKKKNTT